MYERTFVKTPSFWYGLKRPAVSGRENTMPAPNADATSSASTPARATREDLLLGSIVEPPGLGPNAQSTAGAPGRRGARTPRAAAATDRRGAGRAKPRE